jgi:molybdopterin synthase catalytic subunit
MEESKSKSIFIQGPIPMEKITHWLKHHQSMSKDGAHDLFLGQVRADEVEGKAVRHIEYTAYEELATRCISKLPMMLF